MRNLNVVDNLLSSTYNSFLNLDNEEVCYQDEKAEELKVKKVKAKKSKSKTDMNLQSLLVNKLRESTIELIKKAEIVDYDSDIEVILSSLSFEELIYLKKAVKAVIKNKSILSMIKEDKKANKNFVQFCFDF